ncbi:MAG: hypothetical protein JETCAE02_13870 [Anaerolineaceae bacterium]|nr:hypothetical protein [Anaerolineae bacterium]MDL1925037.1 hypothetical protein [Anaerolineae bacterium AMX1]GIK09922.1 MAG: hypothetical protein BroJett001_19880 [Chloroflexota bacterium]GJQ38975.1 MAG: hypothetical protein JETCAE02_13870 [Anaerolineaceae bacterium]HMM98306.1 DUF5615 family PIN-like protein [Anaerolineales bacterium]
MLLLAADENFNSAIVRGLMRVKPDINLVRVQDVGLSAAEDPVILEWAAGEDRVLLTHDSATMTKYALERIRAGKYMPGIIEVNRKVPLGIAIEDILLIAETCQRAELENQILYLPLSK